MLLFLSLSPLMAFLQKIGNAPLLPLENDRNNPDRVPNPVRVNQTRCLRYNTCQPTGMCEYLQKIGNAP
uniref:Uncharacterized protein n=1 Tax=Kuenenia stuttgartiensis TaxID=174633 RepID=Q1Q3A2_KUEST|nr:unknown protein [Candidatus Kuenenia stuttgartiensis]